MQSLEQETIQQRNLDQTENLSINDELVSFIQEIPEYLTDAISSFIDKHPNWDQYRLMQAAISGYLLQKGVDSREINRLYFESMFCKKAFGDRM
tara:strand:+ start:8290 stop:8571 length:282 start_codon:yes stop_codon:yes gene_type:complete